MLTRPETITDEAVLHAVRYQWLPSATVVAHLPVGFGAHHWRVADAAGDALFVTVDELGHRHTPESIESSYAGAAALCSAGFRFVRAPLRSAAGGFTVGLGGDALSVTQWSSGHTPTEAEAAAPDHVRAVLAALAALHSTPAPDGLRRWRSVVPDDLPDRLAMVTAEPWTSGPLGERARTAIAERQVDVATWSARHAELIAAALRHTWVPTHGEPHFANQMITDAGLEFVDWESLALAPRERDLVDVVEYTGVLADPDMIELFRLEWRLSEIDEFARWFAAPHTGSADDTIAFDGLLEELSVGTAEAEPNMPGGATRTR